LDLHHGFTFDGIRFVNPPDSANDQLIDQILRSRRPRDVLKLFKGCRLKPAMPLAAAAAGVPCAIKIAGMSPPKVVGGTVVTLLVLVHVPPASP
jgi:hypothetical protein